MKSATAPARDCSTCKHGFAFGARDIPMCDLEAAMPGSDTPDPDFFAHFCANARSEEAVCGPTATLWSPKA